MFGFCMPIRRTFCILKPDVAQDAQKVSEIQERLKAHGFLVVAQKKRSLTLAEAELFYAEHSHRPFFKDLCAFMTSGPVVLQVLKAENGVAKYRKLMGATDPRKADAQTLRKDFGASIDHNAVHGSDSLRSAAREIAFFEALR